MLAIVAEVPAGRVTTYGSIAEALDIGARQVASVLANDPAATRVSWHRVVASKGRITIPDPDSRRKQIARLQREGIEIVDDRVVKFSAVFYAP